MKKYSIVSLLSILFLVGCSPLFQRRENPIKPSQILSGILQNSFPDEGTISYPGTWTLKTEEATDTGYTYAMNIDEVFEISFNTEKEIKSEDILTGSLQNTSMSISSIPGVIFLTHQYNPLLGTGYGFRVNFSGDTDIGCSYEKSKEGISFPSGSGEMFVKGHFSPDMTYPYVNHFPSPTIIPIIDAIFPGARNANLNPEENPNNWGMNDCLVEIGNVEEITKNLPISFSSGFDNYIFAITKEKSDTSHCRELLQYDYNLLFYTPELFCSLKMNASTKIEDLYLMYDNILEKI